MSDTTIITVLEPDDEYPHEPDDSPNGNGPTYLNAFDLEHEVGGSGADGEVVVLIPLRNRRLNPDGEELTTRITEAMTCYRGNGRTGMSEHLDQVVDGRPTGPDVPARPTDQVASS